MNKPQKQAEAFKLFLSGESRLNICNQVHIAEMTYRKWRKLKGWDKLKEEHEAKVIQKIALNIEEEKERSIKLIKAVEAIFAKKLQSGNLDIKTSEFAQLQRVKWEILAPKTQTQYNFMKQEINQPKMYNFVIDDDKRKVIQKTT